MTTPAPACELCAHDGGRRVYREAGWRVVGVDDAAFPGYYRVVCNAHVAEFSELDPTERARCMTLVATVERTLREALQPTKLNLASLGNQTPHLHWHVIARFAWDSHYPQPVWAAARRVTDAEALARVVAALPALDGLLAERLRYA